MSTQTLLMVALVAMTVVALMIAINSRGRWRATISSLLALCLLGGTTWVFILQYSIGINADVQGERQQIVLRDLFSGRSRTDQPQASPAAFAIITNMNDFANSLLQEKLHDPIYSHAQLIARATSAEQRFGQLQNEVVRQKHILDSIPEAAKLVELAMTELKAACHLYNRYYFAENTDEEITTERLFRQKARSARDSLAKAEKEFMSKK